MRAFTDLAERLVGSWDTEGSHPLLPGEEITGHARFEWLAGHKFLVWRAHYEHPQIPDAIAVIGPIEDQLRMHYFDRRGVYRLYEVSFDGDQWRYWRDDPGFQQSFTGTFSGDGDTITGQGRMNRDDAGWEDDLALTYRRGRPSPTGSAPDLDARARRVIDANHYMTLATIDPDGRPRPSPVYYTPARYADFYWVSSPDAHHSRNIAERPDVQIVIFDSTAAVGEGEAVYLTAQAEAVPEAEVEAARAEAFRTTAGARPFTVDELREAGLRLYVAHLRSCEVHVPGSDPVHGRGLDSRQPADPTAAPGT